MAATAHSQSVTRRDNAGCGPNTNASRHHDCSYSTTQRLLPYHKTENTTLYHGDAATIMTRLDPGSVDCIVTSPPYYGQRDYGVDGQLGLESDPQVYLVRLVNAFDQAYHLLKPGGSLWVIIGDTYWSGKGKPTGPDTKQKHRRFDRPQDKSGPSPRPWCKPKQQLLIPHRFAIAMQEAGWIVRNDNIWHKPAPMPDPADDRSSLAHEFVFHFVKQRRYYYNMSAVAVPSTGKSKVKAPPSVWVVSSRPSRKKHAAVFPAELVYRPILATCPPGGIFLDPFCGSGTALAVAVASGEGRSAIGIDLSFSALEEAKAMLFSSNPS